MLITDPELVRQYDSHLGKAMSYIDKTILDIGADTGTTVEYFLAMGAKFVYALEGDPGRHTELEDTVRKYFSTQAHCLPRLWITSPHDFTYLLSVNDSCDLVKVDIEGFEIHLLGVPDEIFRLPKEYVIDFHSETIRRLLKEKLLKNGYHLHDEGLCNVLYAIREN